MLNNAILVIVPRYLPLNEKAYYEFPLGLAYITSCLKQAGNGVDVLNLNHYEGAQIDILRHKNEGNKYKYFLTGGLSAHYEIIKNIVKDIRSVAPDPVIIVGGGLVTATPELMYDYIHPDYIVLGEGEITVVELISTLKYGDGDDIDNVKGIGYRDAGGKLILTPKREPITDLDRIPFPDMQSFEFEKYLDMQAPNDNLYLYISDKPRFYPIISSRGCPYNCTFCYHPLGQKYRSRSVDNFISEVKYAKETYNVNNFAIFDELLSEDRNRLYELCAKLKKLSVTWMCQLRVTSVDEEMLTVMKDAGCFIVSYGFESASDIILKSMNKHITSKEIEKALELTRKAGIGIQGYFIFGDPAETKETAYETLNFWKKRRDYHITMGYIRPYPGSELWKKKMSRCSDTEHLEFLNKCVNCPPNLSKMSREEWFELQKDVQKAIITNDHCGELLESKEGSITIRCPHCGNTVTYNNFYQRILGVFKLSCRICNQAMNISPLAFKSVRDDFERNIKVFETIMTSKTPIVVTPCMSEAELAAMYEVFLTDECFSRIINYMDISDEKAGKYHLGKIILKRNRENCIEAVQNGHYFLIPLTRFANRIFSHLLSLGVDKDHICRLDEVVYEKLTLNDFVNIFDESVINVQRFIDSADFRYRFLSESETDSTMIQVNNTLLSHNLKASGPHRKEDWETGWNENLAEYISTDNINNLLPKFIRKNEVMRFRGNYIQPLDPDFETNFVKVLRWYLFSKYLGTVSTVYEFGCGTGLNLLALHEMYPEKILYGLDWSKSSLEIINELSRKCNINNLRGILFDMFSPDPEFTVSKNSGILTIGAMEQLGTDFNAFLTYLLNQKPDVVVNVEQNYEVLDKTTLFDYLAAAYIEKRNYLRGFRTALKELENQGKVTIVEEKETVGGLYHTGYSYVVWHPKQEGSV